MKDYHRQDPRPRITDDQRAEIIRRIHAGEYGDQIARAVHVARSTVVSVATAAGLEIPRAVRLSLEERTRIARERESRAVSVSSTERDYWRGQIYNARSWGRGGYAR